jgi:hypothetical protein
LKNLRNPAWFGEDSAIETEIIMQLGKLQLSWQPAAEHWETITDGGNPCQAVSLSISTAAAVWRPSWCERSECLLLPGVRRALRLL